MYKSILKIMLILEVFTFSTFCIAKNVSNVAPKQKEDKSFQALYLGTKKAIVTIGGRSSISAYIRKGRWYGSGFVVDKAAGLIVTNAHVVGGQGTVADYIITFHNGRIAEAKLVYSSIWQDFAILKVDAKEIPENVAEIKFSDHDLKLYEKVFMIGNTEGMAFSMHSGTISDIYTITGLMPQASYIINVNIVGGASGSPLINRDGKAIGVVYGGGNTFALALNGKYVIEALKNITSNAEPVAHHIGVLLYNYSLDNAAKYRNFPVKLSEEYLKNHPEFDNKVLAVDFTIPGTPAYSILQSKDIIWEVNGIKVGNDLYAFDKALNNTKVGEKVKLTVYRAGTKVDLEIPIYDVNESQIKEMVEFGGAIFYKADDMVSAFLGCPRRSLVISNIKGGSSFTSLPFVSDEHLQWNTGITPNSISNYQIKTLDDLVKIIPEMMKKQYITIGFKNYLPAPAGFDNRAITQQLDLSMDIKLDNNDVARVYKFSDKNLKWESKEIER